jgi:cell division ATPase FtsA
MLRIIVEARAEEILEYVDKELKKIHRSRKLPGGIVLVGGTSKLPGLVELTKECMGLPARVGTWGHIPKVVDGLDEQLYGPAVGLMLLDMLLGPPAHAGHFSDSQPGVIDNVTATASNLLKRFRKH